MSYRKLARAATKFRPDTFARMKSSWLSRRSERNLYTYVCVQDLLLLRQSGKQGVSLEFWRATHR